MVYDCTQINDELDMLEIRLNILDPFVDFFVIGESYQTFSGKYKPLYYLDNEDRFARWNHKIIHHIMPYVETDDVFERTAIQKDSLRAALKGCKPDDVIYYGDCDEVPNPEIMPYLCVTDTDVYSSESIYKLEQWNYCYYLNQRSSECWQGTNVCKYKNLVNLNELRANHQEVVPCAGWHWSNQGGIDKLRNKIASYDHQEMINEDVREKLEERMENGEDYLGRSRDWQGKPFEYWLDESELPKYIIDNKSKWIHLFK